MAILWLAEENIFRSMSWAEFESIMNKWRRKMRLASQLEDISSSSYSEGFEKYQHRSYSPVSMNRRVLLCILQLMLLTSTGFLDISVEAKKVIINVPYRVKNVKHTHTIYKIIPHYHKSKSHGHLHSGESEHSDYYR